MFCFAPLFFERDENAEDIRYDVTEEFYHK